MKRLIFAVFFAALTAAATAQKSDAPALMELFTSQGCSSCPPAERWLNTRGLELYQQGKIIPLAFHVDYWNYLGWKDPFSSPVFSVRQRNYASAFQENSVYTPQMVVAGRVGFVGSDGPRIEKECSDPRNHQAQKIQLTLQGVQLKIALPHPLGQGEKLYLAVFENQKVTQVLSGENEGKTLEENFVVTKLEELHSLSLPLPSNKSGIVVFAQDGNTLEITALGSMVLK